MKISRHFISALMGIVFFTICERNTEKRKIKLADQNTITRIDEQLTTTVHLEPSMRRAIAVLFFENKTGDQNLEWLQKGLTEMIIRSLSQSHYLSVLSTERLYTIFEQMNQETLIDMDIAAVVAEEANLEALITGHIQKNGDSLEIIVKVQDPLKGNVLKEESVEGPGLENLFGMVDQLTEKIKKDLQLTRDQDEIDSGIAHLSTGSLDAWRHYTAGVEFLYKALFNDAVQQFEKTIELDSTFVSAYYYLTWLLVSQEESHDVDRVFRKLRGLRGKATERERYQIDLLEARIENDYQRMIEVGHRWLEQYPDDRDVNLYLAGLNFTLLRWDEAVYYYQRLLKIDPRHKMAYNDLGYIYANRGDFSNAMKTLKQYKKVAQEEPNPYDSMGEVYLYQGDYRNAEKQFKKAIKTNSLFYPSLYHLGETYLDEGNYLKALRIFQEYSEKATDRSSKATAYTQSAMTHWRLGDDKQAIADLEKAMENQDNPYRLTALLNEIYLEKNDTARIMESWERTYNRIKIELRTNPALINSLASLSLWADINIQETIQIINKTLSETDNKSAQLWGQFFRGLLTMKSNDLSEAGRFASNFTNEFIAQLKDVRNIPYNYYTWKSFLIFNEYFDDFPKEGIDRYNAWIQFCVNQELKISEMIFRLFLAELNFRIEDTKKGHEQLVRVGSPEENVWMFIGPFDNKEGFLTRFPPERKIELNTIYKTPSESITWIHSNDKNNEGYINLKQMFKRYNWSVAYGLIYVNSPTIKDVQFRIGSNEAIRVWINDTEIWRMNKVRDSIFDNDIFPVSLQPGLNKILMKVCNRVGEWGYYFRITDTNGNGIADMQFISPDQVENKK